MMTWTELFWYCFGSSLVVLPNLTVHGFAWLASKESAPTSTRMAFCSRVGSMPCEECWLIGSDFVQVQQNLHPFGRASTGVLMHTVVADPPIMQYRYKTKRKPILVRLQDRHRLSSCQSKRFLSFVHARDSVNVQLHSNKTKDVDGQ